MPKMIYAIPHNNLPTEYFNTRAEAVRDWRSQDEPERIEALDAAEQCNGLTRMVKDLDDMLIETRVALKGLVAVCPDDILKETTEGRRAVQVVREFDPDFVESCGL